MGCVAPTASSSSRRNGRSALPGWHPVDAKKPQGAVVLRNDHDRHVSDPDQLDSPDLSFQVPVDLPVGKMLQPSIPIIDQHIPVIGIVPPALGGGIMEIADADYIWKAVSVQIQDQETMDRGKLAGDRQFDLRKTVAPVVKDSGPQFSYGILNGPVEQPPVNDLMQPRFGKGPVGFKSLVHGWQLLIQLILGCEEAFTAVFVDPRDDLLDGAVAV